MTPHVQFSFLHLLQHHILLLHCLMSITRKKRRKCQLSEVQLEFQKETTTECKEMIMS